MTKDEAGFIIPAFLVAAFVASMLYFSRIKFDRRGSVVLGHWLLQIVFSAALALNAGAMAESWYTSYIHDFRAGISGLALAVPVFAGSLFYFRHLMAHGAGTATVAQ